MVLLSKLCLVAAAIATVGLNSLNVEGNELVKPIGKSISHSSFEDNIDEYEQRIRRLGGYNSYNNYNNAFLFSKFKKSGTTDSSSKGKFFNKKDSSDGKGKLFGKKFDSSSSDGKDGLFGKKGGLFNKKDSSSSDNKGGLFSKKFGSSSSSDGKGKLFSKKGGLFNKKDSSSSDNKGGLFGKKFGSSSDNKSGKGGKFGKGSRDSSSDSSDSSDSSNGKFGLFSKKKSWLFGKKDSSDSSSSGNKGGLLSKVFRKKDSSSSSSSRSSSSSNGKGGLLSKKFGKKFDSSSSDRKGGLLGKVFGKKRSSSSSSDSSSSSRSKSKSSSSDDDDNDRFALRINCGGLGTDDYCEDYRYFNVNGDLWYHDCEYQDNDHAQIFKVSDDIYDIDENGYKFLADDQEIYQSERFIRDDDLVYNFDVNNGKYFIKLYFAEMFFTTRHERIFDIVIEGEVVEYDLDIYSRVGHDTALVLQYNDIYVDDHVLTIKFLKNVQDPKVNGIEIFQVE